MEGLAALHALDVLLTRNKTEMLNHEKEREL